MGTFRGIPRHAQLSIVLGFLAVAVALIAICEVQAGTPGGGTVTVKAESKKKGAIDAQTTDKPAKGWAALSTGLSIKADPITFFGNPDTSRASVTLTITNFAGGKGSGSATGVAAGWYRVTATAIFVDNTNAKNTRPGSGTADVNVK